MAKYSVFMAGMSYPHYEEVAVEQVWFGGFALSQKRKREINLHANFLRRYPERKVLEISGQSLTRLGRQLSAMNLWIATPEGKPTTVEAAFQSSRVYFHEGRKIGPLVEYLYADGKTAKLAVKEASQREHSYLYEYFSVRMGAPDYHISLFYDYLYLTALMAEENRAVREQLLAEGWDAFTDCATKALNSQARSCAIFVGLARAGLLDETSTLERFLALFRTEAQGREGQPIAEHPVWTEAEEKGFCETGMPGAYENVRLLGKNGWPEVCEVVPCTFGGEETQTFYAKYYGELTNKRDDDRAPGGVSVLLAMGVGKEIHDPGCHL